MELTLAYTLENQAFKLRRLINDERTSLPNAKKGGPLIQSAAPVVSVSHLAGEPALSGTQAVLLLPLAAVEVVSVVLVRLQEFYEAARHLGKLLLHPGLLDALRSNLQLRMRRMRMWFTCIRKSIIFCSKGTPAFGVVCHLNTSNTSLVNVYLLY